MRRLALALAVCGLAVAIGATASVGSAKTAKAAKPTTLTIAQSGDPVSLDPLQQRVTATYSVLRNLYDPLVDFANQGTTFDKFIPVLATKWKQLSPTKLQFTLRKGVKLLRRRAVQFLERRLLGQGTAREASARVPVTGRVPVSVIVQGRRQR